MGPLAFDCRRAFFRDEAEKVTEYRIATTLKRVGGATMVPVPADFRRRAGLEPGEALLLVRGSDGRVAIEPLKPNEAARRSVSRRVTDWLLDRPCGREAF